MNKRLLCAIAVLSLGLLIGADGNTQGVHADSFNKSQAKAQFEKARALAEAGKPEPAIDMLLKLIAASPQSPYVPQAYLLLGQILTDMRNTAEASVYYRRLLEEYPASDLAPKAKLGLATIYLTSGNPDGALPLLLEARDQTSDPSIKLTVLRHLEELYLAKHDYLRAIESSVQRRNLSAEENRLMIEVRVRDLLRNKLGEQDLRLIADRYPQAFPGDAALLRLLDLHTARGEEHKVARTAREFLRRFPTHELAGDVTILLAAERKKLKAKTFLIGAVLPLSGPLGSYGNEVLNGIRIALDRAAESMPPSMVGLVTKDTEGDPKQLTLLLEDLLSDYHPIAVIGPLLSRELKTVAMAADSYEVVFVTPTATILDVQRLGRYLFNTAGNNRTLVRDLVAYTTGPLGWRRFCVLAPRDAYGAEMSQLFAEEIRRLGGEIIASDSYAPGDTDFGPAIQRIKEADLKQHGKLVTVSKKGGKQIKIYTPGYNAIFLPGEAEKVGLIAGQLPFYAAKVAIMGTNGMNSTDLVRIGDRAVEGAIFADSFFVDSPDPNVRDFVERYVKRFQEPPSAFAAQAYEATLLILDALLKGATTSWALRNSLMTVKNLPGLAGPLTMSSTGYLERRYALIQVRGGKFFQVTDGR